MNLPVRCCGIDYDQGSEVYRLHLKRAHGEKKAFVSGVDKARDEMDKLRSKAEGPRTPPPYVRRELRRQSRGR